MSRLQNHSGRVVAKAFFAARGGRESGGGEGASRSVKGLAAPCLPVPQTGPLLLPDLENSPAKGTLGLDACPIPLIVSTFSVLTRELMGRNDILLQLCCILLHKFVGLLR